MAPLTSSLSRSMAGHTPAAASMRASRSAPGLFTQGNAVRQTLHHRGEGQIGAVAGVTDDDTYVPRANWTETYDSPMKTRSMDFNAHAFMAEEDARQENELKKKELMRQSHLRHMEQRQTLKKAEVDEMREYFKTLEEGDGGPELARRQTMSAQTIVDNRRKLKEGLDEQKAHMRRRAQEQRLQEAHEGAELKMRTALQTAEEQEFRQKKKDAYRKHAAETLRVIEARRREAREAKETADFEARQEYARSTLGEKDRNAAKNARMSEIQKKMAHHDDVYTNTAGREEFQKMQKEMARVDRDEQMHATRLERHYHAREAGRERQRMDFIATLGVQSDANKRRKELMSLQGQVEKDAINQSLAQFMNLDVQKQAHKRAEEVQLQQELIAMMAEKQERERRENPHARRAPWANTMNPPPATGGRGATAEQALQKNVEASRHLDKPLGKVEAKPWIDMAQAHFGGAAGAYSGEGGFTRAALLATGGTKRILTKSSKLMSQHHHMDAAWHEGLTAAEMKAGRAAAARREANNALSRAECPP